MNDKTDFIAELKVRYPYQFTGQDIGLHVPVGWQAIFAKLCADIDAVITEEEKPLFNWVQLKEKFGTARFYAEFAQPDEVPSLLPSLENMTIEQRGAVLSFRPLPGNEAMRKLILDAEAATVGVCLKCGRPGKMYQDGWWRTLCEEHEAEYQAKARFKGLSDV